MKAKGLELIAFLFVPHCYEYCYGHFPLGEKLIYACETPAGHQDNHAHIQCNQAREQNFLKPYFWAKNYTDRPT